MSELREALKACINSLQDQVDGMTAGSHLCEPALTQARAALAAQPEETFQARGIGSPSAAIIRDVAELPDRNSPEDAPVTRSEMMLVTASELEQIIEFHLPAPAVPEGAALVPINPTSEMAIAALNWQKTTYVCDPLGDPARFYAGIYRVMLAAAPAAGGSE